MKRIVLWMMSTATVLVLLFGYHTSTSSKAVSGGESSILAPVTGGVATAPTTTTPSAATASSTVTGDVASTQWGPVQVQLTVTDGKIAEVSVVQYPNGTRRDEEINSRALPILIQETLDAQNAQVDMVSGATVTSEGYLQSLQSALDRSGR